MKRIKDLLSKSADAVSAWCKAHESFIAVKLTRLIAVIFMAVSFYFLLKSLGLV